jgi:hypothetical protein
MNAAEIAGALGVRVVGWQMATTGQGRAAFADTDDGRPVVVKVFTDPERACWVPSALQHAETLRRRGYPAPRTLAHGAVPGGYGLVQERLPGQPCAGGLDAGLLAQVIAAVDLQADAELPLDDPDWSYVDASIHDDEDGYWRRARALGPEVRAFCDQLNAWVRGVPRAARRRDYVHLDLNLTNILAHDGRLTGIVDLDHVGAGGDRAVDLAAVLLDLAFLDDDAGVATLHRRIHEVSGEPGWRQAVTYNAIGWLGWSETVRSSPERAMAVVRAIMRRH